MYVVFSAYLFFSQLLRRHRLSEKYRCGEKNNIMYSAVCVVIASSFYQFRAFGY